ncbi:hypothetical protein TREAZ_2822 [Leadbettera azotonutricia ZAS-9]|uniref:Uncharacterized protein n=1 Tax=Leadbettera azotonutricia (strain ATCC BAA-888 / DSM 13862 / ZAS-9) TaxID=545695 RepID=F5YCI8_LEAAZ|nr:hypothetical protein TREAZ_2822 [Leadbettera azotonutricia ZAS-9]
MFISILILLLVISLTIALKNISIKKINNLIDKKFKEGFYARTNGFIRFFINKFNKYQLINQQYTRIYRKRANMICNITMAVLITFWIILFLVRYIRSA